MTHLEFNNEKDLFSFHHFQIIQEFLAWQLTFAKVFTSIACVQFKTSHLLSNEMMVTGYGQPPVLVFHQEICGISKHFSCWSGFSIFGLMPHLVLVSGAC